MEPLSQTHCHTVIAEVRRMADLELVMTQKRFDMELRQKDCEIDRFKIELDNILTTLFELKRQGFQVPHRLAWTHDQPDV